MGSEGHRKANIVGFTLMPLGFSFTFLDCNKRP